MSVRNVAFGAAGRAFNGCRDGQLRMRCCPWWIPFRKIIRGWTGDAIPMGLSEIRKYGRTRLLKDEMSTGALRALLSVQKPVRGDKKLQDLVSVPVSLAAPS